MNSADATHLECSTEQKKKHTNITRERDRTNVSTTKHSKKCERMPALAHSLSHCHVYVTESCNCNKIPLCGVCLLRNYIYSSVNFLPKRHTRKIKCTRLERNGEREREKEEKKTEEREKM